MQPVLRASFPALIIASSGCLPERDNLFDPAVAPRVSFAIVGIPPASDGSCPAVATWPSVVDGSRGTCLALDARGSEDPQGKALTFDYAITAPPSAVRDLGTDEGEVFELGGVIRRSLPVDVSVEFEVTARDPGGALTRATRSIVLRNEPPVARVQPSRSLPEGGFPWTAGTPFDVAFDASASSDPDHDLPLHYCWSFDAAPAVCSTSLSDPQFTRSLPAERSYTVATLQVHDRDPASASPERKSSRVASTTVSVREPNLWAVPVFASTVERIDSAHAVFLIESSNRGSGAFVPQPAEDRVAFVGDSSDLYSLSIAPWPSASPVVTSIPLVDVAGSNPRGNAVAYDPVNDVIWAHVGDAGTPGPLLCSETTTSSLFRVRPSDGNVLGTTSLPFQNCVEIGTSLLVTGSDGSAWATSAFGPSLARVSPTGTLGAVTTTPGRVWTGLAARPDSAEVWAVESPDFLDGAGSGNATLVRFDGPTDPGTDFPLERAVAIGLAFVSPYEAWVHLAAEGLALVDFDLLTVPGATFDDAIVLVVPDILDSVSLLGDPATGACWAVSASIVDETVYRVSRSGDIETHGTLITFPSFVDPEGALWWTDKDGIGRGFSPGIDGVVSSIEIFGFTGAALDLSSGSVWVPGAIPPALWRVAEEGTVLDFLPAARIGGVETLLPFLNHFRVSPDGSTAWGLGFTTSESALGLYRIDLNTRGPDRPPDAVIVLDSAAAEDIEATFQILEPSAPVPASTPFVWLSRTVAAVPTIVAMAADGNSSVDRFPFPADEQTRVRAARSMSTNRLCLATEDQNGGVFRLRSIPVTGAVTALGTISRTAGMTLVAAAASENPAMCWMAVYDDTAKTSTIQGWTVAGAPFRRHDEVDFEVTSFVPYGSDAIWFTAYDVTTNEEIEKIRVDQWNAGTMLYERRQTLQPTREVLLSAPNAQGADPF